MERSDSLPSTVGAASAADAAQRADSPEAVDADIRDARTRVTAPAAGQVTAETAALGGDAESESGEVRESRLAGVTETRQAAMEVAHPDRSVTTPGPDGEPGQIFADPAAGIGPLGGAEVGGWEDVRAGMEVVGLDGESVGLVKEVHAQDFLLDRVMRRDLWVPKSAVERVILDVVPEKVVLNIRGADVAVMDWGSPPLA